MNVGAWNNGSHMVGPEMGGLELGEGWEGGLIWEGLDMVRGLEL